MIDLFKPQEKLDTEIKELLKDATSTLALTLEGAKKLAIICEIVACLLVLIVLALISTNLDFFGTMPRPLEMIIQALCGLVSVIQILTSFRFISTAQRITH